MSKQRSLNSKCPICSIPMEVASLECRACELTLQGQFDFHPLMKLDGEMLHFLHVFIVCEGKIADMERALGISYPTVKNKLQKLKEAVASAGSVAKIDPSITPEAPLASKSVIEILEMMNRKEIGYEDGLLLIKAKRKMEKKK